MYSLAGVITAGATGVVLGALGGWLNLTELGSWRSYGISLLAVVLAARDLGIVEFYLPAPQCQTQKRFANNRGFNWAVVAWGAHIGLGFATRISYSGFWLIVAMAVTVGDPVYGAALLILYWLGRALSVWLAPLLLPPQIQVSGIVAALKGSRHWYHWLSGAALIWSAAAAALLPS